MLRGILFVFSIYFLSYLVLAISHVQPRAGHKRCTLALFKGIGEAF